MKVFFLIAVMSCMFCSCQEAVTINASWDEEIPTQDDISTSEEASQNGPAEEKPATSSEIPSSGVENSQSTTTDEPVTEITLDNTDAAPTNHGCLGKKLSIDRSQIKKLSEINLGVQTPLSISRSCVATEVETEVETGTDAAEATPTPQIDITDDPLDYFLSSDDIITAHLKENGDGEEGLDEILYGAPHDVYDVLSLGDGGSVTIALNGFQIANGDGEDFIVFENAFANWQECGEVSVSEDGRNYQSFPCLRQGDTQDIDDCAGVTAVAYGLSDSAYRNPQKAGGDAFDLADLAIPLARAAFLKITDKGICGDTPGEIGAMNGFDLDAVSIVNGLFE